MLKYSWCSVLVNTVLIPLLGAGPTFAQVDTSEFETFADWCNNRKQLAPAVQHTVQVLLDEANTQDCDEAQDFFANPYVLDLRENQIENITPLSSLSNFKWLRVLHGKRCS